MKRDFLMTSNLKLFLNKIVDPQYSEHDNKRWVYSINQGVKYTKEYKNIGNFKIEKVFSKLINKLDTFHEKTIDAEDQDKLIKLMKMIKNKTESYKNKHKGFFGFFYLLFSKILYGNIDDLNEKLLAKINYLLIEQELKENAKKSDLDILYFLLNILKCQNKKSDMPYSQADLNLILRSLSNPIKDLKALRPSIRHELKNLNFSADTGEALSRLCESLLKNDRIAQLARNHPIKEKLKSIFIANQLYMHPRHQLKTDIQNFLYAFFRITQPSGEIVGKILKSINPMGIEYDKMKDGIEKKVIQYSRELIEKNHWQPENLFPDDKKIRQKILYYQIMGDKIFIDLTDNSKIEIQEIIHFCPNIRNIKINEKDLSKGLLTKLPRLESLEVIMDKEKIKTSFYWSEQVFNFINEAKELKNLKFNVGGFFGVILCKKLSSLVNLRSLKFDDCRLNFNRSFLEIDSLKKLESVEIQNCELDYPVFSNSKLPDQLKEIKLNGSRVNMYRKEFKNDFEELEQKYPHLKITIDNTTFNKITFNK